MKIDTKIIHHVDYNDLDEAINEFLKEKGCKEYDFEFVCEYEACNDTSYEISVGKYDWAKIKEKGKQKILESKKFS